MKVVKDRVYIDFNGSQSPDLKTGFPMQEFSSTWDSRYYTAVTKQRESYVTLERSLVKSQLTTRMTPSKELIKLRTLSSGIRQITSSAHHTHFNSIRMVQRGPRLSLGKHCVRGYRHYLKLRIWPQTHCSISYKFFYPDHTYYDPFFLQICPL